MIRAILSFFVIFLVAWFILLFVKIYEPAQKMCQNVSEEKVAQLVSERVKVTEEKMRYEREVAELELALQYKLENADIAMSVARFTKWMGETYFPTLPERLNPLNDLPLSPTKEGAYKKMINEIEAARKLPEARRQRLKHINDHDLKKLSAKEQELQQEIKKLKQLQLDLKKALKEYVYHGWPSALWLSVMFSLAVISSKFFFYYVLAPLVERNARHVELSIYERGGYWEEHQSDGGCKLVCCELNAGEGLLLKSESYCGGYSQRNEQLKKQLHWIYSVKYWYMSFMCGLVLMTRMKNIGQVKQSVYITSDDPDEYFCLRFLREGEQLFVVPGDLVAFSDGVEIEAQTHWNSVTAWAMGQVRYYILKGKGQVVLRAHGGMTRMDLDDNQAYVHKKHSVIQAGGKLRFRACRTETFIPYLLGQCSLFDQQVQGEGAYHIRNTSRKTYTTSERISHVLFSSLGKFLGF